MYASQHVDQLLHETQAQRHSQHMIYQQLGRHRKPNQPCTVREAAKELLHTDVSYDGSTNLSTVKPYERDLVSLPDVGATLVPLSQVLDPVGRDVVESPLEKMLLSEDEWGHIAESNSGFRPYMDTILQKDPNRYNLFVKDLWAKNMVDFTASPKDLIAPFFVKKENGKLRLVLDCRGVNRRFHAPPPMALSAGSTWSQISLPEGQHLSIAQSDIKDYFYSLELPTELKDFFCLPAIPVHCLQEWKVDSSSSLCGDDGGWIYPRLRAVPMGWNWAMWIISQRAHQRISLQASGLSIDRVLVEGKPCPDLSDGEVILVPYADNLNVAGTCPERVQTVKDKIVEELRRLGFRVHEETDACTLAQSLGFLIDGEAGVIVPIPGRWDRIVKAFEWLSHRPSVTGRQIERLLGHAMHICLLRRELLSLFRSLYDFLFASYNKRQKLWPSAAREARWCSHVLKLCSVDLRRNWSTSVTASDASLSGIAVCSRTLSEAVQTRLGDQREPWRYKSKIPVNPRASALSDRDPFADPETVRPIAKPAPVDPYELDVNFEEVDKEYLKQEDWHECFAIHMQHSEHITLLEGRGVVAALRHKLRSCQEFGRKHLHFCDNMGMTLLLAKGRSGTYGMLRICRRVACLLIASDCSLAVRWVPSELNIADGPSRRWEHLRSDHVESRAQKEQGRQAILETCYPGRAQERYGTKVVATGGLTKGAKKKDFFHNGSSDGGSEKSAKGSEIATEGRRPEIPRSDSFRNDGSLRPRSRRLPSSGSGTEVVCKETKLEPESEEQLRLGLLQVCQQHVRARLRLPRRNQNHGSNHRCLPRLRPQAHVAAHSASATRVAQSRASANKASNSMAPASRNVHGADLCKEEDQCPGRAADVHGVSTSRRTVRLTKNGLDTSNARFPILCTAPSSSDSSTTIQGGSVRRVPDAGLPFAAMAGKCGATVGFAPNVSDRSILRQVGEGLEMGIAEDGTPGKSCSFVPTATFRSKFRQTAKTPKSGRGQTKRQVELRHKCEEIRGACQNLTGVLHAARGGTTQVPSDGTPLSTGGPKTFSPSQSAEIPKKKFVLEIFSGCARLSRACSACGFSAIAYDIEYGSACDVLQSRVLASLLKFITNHAFEIALVWMGTPCTTWSRARKNDGGPPALRDDGDFLWGSSDLQQHDLEKISQGNALLEVSSQIARLCASLSVPWVIENPLTSRIWLTSSLQQLVCNGASFIHTDFCAFGMPWRKSTGLMFQHFDTLNHVSKHCKTFHGRCSFTERKHIVLTGKDSNGVWLTRRAQPYPYKLCWQIAQALLSNT